MNTSKKIEWLTDCLVYIEPININGVLDAIIKLHKFKKSIKKFKKKLFKLLIEIDDKQEFDNLLNLSKKVIYSAEKLELTYKKEIFDYVNKTNHSSLKMYLINILI